MWYRTGSINVTTNSPVVTGTGTDFVANVTAGSALVAQDGRAYEVQSIESATSLTLASPYLGGSSGNVAYAIYPTQSLTADLAKGVAALLNTFASVRDGVGQGLFPDGSMAAPGMRFIADQDTGFARYGPNLLSAVAGGVERMRFGETNSSTAPFVAVDGATCQRSGDASSLVVPLSIYGAIGGTATMRIRFGSGANQYAGHSFIEAQTLTASASDLRFGVSGVEAGRFDSAGNFLVGVASGGNHRIVKSVGEGITVLSIGGANTEFIYLNSVTTQGWSNAATAISVGRHSGNGRSVNAGGTINANGADYAEYMPKAAGCGIIAKGDVCGVDRDGRLTTTWADAISFVVKSTDPSLVGGDTWTAHLPPRPEQEEDETDEAFAAREAEWSAALEQARLCVDRIAFCGQVPCNVTGDFEVGDYIVAAASGAGIKAVAVKLDDMTLAQYARRIGKVWAIRDGRAWIDVQHG
ncbi:hypothetical protein SPKIRA_08490 [Sphingomonas paucimobilis]|uniref:hypothetical protein n=1 Tax=Sphingomonas paucimobilis TaxID=13689 RepID=UPI0015DC99CE|nr:hypothetical protein [Sphingomonas paucimobilis]BCI70019.1 hypothetical protein SPKIRA_08490 [Sphingomonas paucimobilis]